jgi:hypothetical protein
LPLKNFEPPSETRSETFRNAQHTIPMGLPRIGQ